MSKLKTALVTGASRGIGRAIAMELAARNVRVVVHYKQNKSAAEETLAKIGGAPHQTIQADLADPRAVEEAMNLTLQKVDNIDIVVNNAGVHTLHPPLETDYESWQEEWQRTLATNLFGPANLTFLAAKHMVQSNGGRIVTVSSRGAFRGEPDAPAYGASKAGLNAMSQSMAQALAPHGVMVYLVAPGFVETDMVKPMLSGPQGDAIRQQSPFGRVAKPQEVAQTVAFLALDAPVFLSGCIVDVNGASYLRS